MHRTNFVIATFVLLCLLYATGARSQNTGNDSVIVQGGVRAYKADKADKIPTPTFDLNSFLAKTIIYPDSARENNTEGRVLVSFVVDEDGNVVNPEIISSPDQSLSQEVLRVIGKMPKWNAGMKNGHTVKVYYKLPVVFKLEGWAGRHKKRRR